MLARRSKTRRPRGHLSHVERASNLTSPEASDPEPGQPPLVCICIPTYNAAGTIRESLESILTQTYRNIVVHVSDNCSTDDTLNVVASMADDRVTIHCQDVKC
jgi:succinyl-CoA synthetase alpha subunit